MLWLKNIILSEADDEIDEPATMSDGETPDVSETPSDEEPITTEDNSASTDEVDEPATMSDGEETTEGDEEETTEDTGDETSTDGEEDVTAEDTTTEDETTEEDQTGDENLKKIKLVDEYRELYDIVNNIKTSFLNLEGNISHNKTEILDNIERINQTLLDDILFILTYKFETESYIVLLKNFYQFKFQLTSIMKVMEFLIQDDEKNKQ